MIVYHVIHGSYQGCTPWVSVTESCANSGEEVILKSLHPPPPPLPPSLSSCLKSPGTCNFPETLTYMYQVDLLKKTLLYQCWKPLSTYAASLRCSIFWISDVTVVKLLWEKEKDAFGPQRVHAWAFHASRVKRWQQFYSGQCNYL